ncbi:rhodanese-like domain-containing protein [candidate division KSB1 bacterium]|nr:rhodanese-like domain-containing protein [candidate division KSB1 bacterium]
MIFTKFNRMFFVILLTGCLWQCANHVVRENREFGISAQELKVRLETNADFLLLDVRTADEYYAGHIEKARLFPAKDIFLNSNQLPKDQDIILYCSDGTRSLLVSRHLRENGFLRVRRMDGGIKSWSWSLMK